ncbi:MAG TPA: hypothetical protein VGW36_02685 [Pyrinomonadaceae bacterium]|nr:hypothetical protein [Pyrinomonadaceae bacterium]
MKGRVAGLISMLRTFAIGALLTTSLTTVYAQTTGARPGRDPADGAGRNKGIQQPSIREREIKMRQIEQEAAQPAAALDQKRWLAEIAEDFEQIQVINNKMMTAAMNTKVPDYANIASATAEIVKRAGRMKRNLSLPEVQEKEKQSRAEYKSVVDFAGMKVALLVLDSSITDLVTNPIFTNPSVIDIQHAAKVKRNLDDILNFGGLIHKDAKKLSKP